MSQLRRSKQEEKDDQAIQALLKEPSNKKCFDCPNKIPSYVNLSIQVFICSRCSGLVREVGHRVKSLTASNFSGPETVALQYGGNAVAQGIWLRHYKGTAPEPETDSDVRWFMRQKYYESKWCDQELLKSHMEKVRDVIKEVFNADGQRRPQAKVVVQQHTGVLKPPVSRNSIPNAQAPKPQVNTSVPNEKRLSWMDDNIPIGLSRSSFKQSNIKTAVESFGTSSPPPIHAPLNSNSNQHHNLIGLPTSTVPISPTQSPTPSKSAETSLFDDLASLQIDTKPKLPLYAGGMLSPSQVGQAQPSRPPAVSSSSAPNVPTTSTSSRNASPPTYSSTISWNYGDPYSVFRNFPEHGQADKGITTARGAFGRQSSTPHMPTQGQPPAAADSKNMPQVQTTLDDQFFESLDPLNMNT